MILHIFFSITNFKGLYSKLCNFCILKPNFFTHSESYLCRTRNIDRWGQYVPLQYIPSFRPIFRLNSLNIPQYIGEKIPPPSFGKNQRLMVQFNHKWFYALPSVYPRFYSKLGKSFVSRFCQFFFYMTKATSFNIVSTVINWACSFHRQFFSVDSPRCLRGLESLRHQGDFKKCIRTQRNLNQN